MTCGDGRVASLENPDYRLLVSDPESIATRTDEWDPAPTVSHAACVKHLVSDLPLDVLAALARKVRSSARVLISSQGGNRS
jgi:hypothetical protein